MDDFNQKLEACAGRVHGELEAHLSAQVRAGEQDWPQRLRAAMQHGALNGGKRLRPFLVLQSAALFGEEGDLAMRTACALECIHCYSLVHDDLPAMDDDDLRRGKPTVHIAYDEATAILAGDALLTFAFDLISQPAPGSDPKIQLKLVSALARAAGAGAW